MTTRDLTLDIKIRFFVIGFLVSSTVFIMGISFGLTSLIKDALDAQPALKVCIQGCLDLLGNGRL